MYDILAPYNTHQWYGSYGTPMWTTTVMVYSIPVIYCRILRPTVFLFITLSNWCDHAINLFYGKFTKNWREYISQPIHIFCFYGYNLDFYLSSTTILYLFRYVSPFDEWYIALIAIHDSEKNISNLLFISAANLIEL